MHEKPTKMEKIPMSTGLMVGFVDGLFVWINSKANKNGKNN